ncbi:MAG: prephenate dehydratase [Lachnospiraceae bacterium]
MLRIGYQGAIGSNSEEAARQIAERLQMEQVEFVPLINSKPVINALLEGTIDYAVVATKNSVAGIVKETEEAVEGIELVSIETQVLHIHHCLFKRKEVDIEELKAIASHEQALKQTQANRLNYFSNLREVEVEDTAIAARYLSEGRLEESIAVLCRKNAGELYGLEMIYENLEDNRENFTTFELYKLK